MFCETVPMQPFEQAAGMLRGKYSLDVYVEPGTSIIQCAGHLVGSVVDLSPSGGAMIAVLDASVNHLPETFELQFEPSIEGDMPKAGHPYVLSGSICLAGDIFGEYSFCDPLKPGSRVVVLNAGACRLLRRYAYQDFKCMAEGQSSEST
jgi:carboxynorspermidine decarboxylase